MRLRAFSLLLWLLALGGCGLSRTTLAFRTVDAATGRPLSGVTSTCREEQADIVFGVRNTETLLAPSNGEGLVQAADLRASWHQTFTFEHPGYCHTYARRSH